MNNRKNVNTVAVAIFLCSFFTFVYGTILPIKAHAEIFEIEAEGRYLIGDGLDESIGGAKEQAFESAKRMATEKAGVYVKSYSKVVDSKLVEDNITTIAGSILEILDKDIRLNPAMDGKTIEVVCKIRTRVDTSKINIDSILEKEEQLRKISEQNKRIRELEDEAKVLKEKYDKLSSMIEKDKIREKYNENRNKSLITIYEKDLDVYNLQQQVDMNNLMDTAKKLSTIDQYNPTAYRAITYYYRNRGDYQNAINYSKKILESNPTVELSIEIYTQLASLYAYDINDRNEAIKYVNQGIILTRKKYNKVEIENYVNGDNIIFESMQLKGKTNTIRELYVMKSDLENWNPSFEYEVVIDGYLLDKYSINNIKYRTDWTGFEPEKNIIIKQVSSKEFDRELEKGNNGKICVIGIGLPPNTQHDNRSVIYAYQAARIDGICNLMNVVDGVVIYGEDGKNVNKRKGIKKGTYAKVIFECRDAKDGSVLITIEQ